MMKVNQKIKKIISKFKSSTLSDSSSQSTIVLRNNFYFKVQVQSPVQV